MTHTFSSRLRTALTGTPDTALVFVGNFEVEDRWAQGEAGLPRLPSAAQATAVVNRMDEFTLLLGGARDHVVLKDEPDPDFLVYLAELGFELPTILVPAVQDPQHMVTTDALADPALVAALAALPGPVALTAHGISDAEQELARRSGVTLAAPDAAVCKAVNSKVYSRELATELGLRQPDGRPCRTLDELTAAFEWATARTPVVIKDAFGVSGKGIQVVRDPARLGRLLRKIESTARRRGTDRVALVVEQWVAKRADLNYQFTVSRDGAVHFDFVKEALTEDGVHKGHRFPARLTGRQVDELTDAAQLIGKRLAADGYYGVVGVDAMVDPDDGLYPVVEINARYNMSTYQAAVQERFMTGDAVALARHWPMPLERPVSFGTLRRALDGVLLTEESRRGLVVHNFATVNAGVPGQGRLYGVVVADSADGLDALDHEITNRLQEVRP